MDNASDEIVVLENIINAKKKNLSKIDQQKSVESLSILLSDRQTMEKGLDMLFMLPSRVGRESFLTAWQTSSDDSYKAQLIEQFRSHKSTGNAQGQFKCLPVARVLIEDAPDTALKIMTDWCLRVTKSNHKIPGSKAVRHFRDEIINGNVLKDLRLQGNVNARQMSAIALILLYCLLSDKPERESPERVFGYLEWINGSGVRISFTTDTSKEILNVMREWSEDVIDAVFNAGMLTGVNKEQIAIVPTVTVEAPTLVESSTVIAQDSAPFEPSKPTNNQQGDRVVKLKTNTTPDKLQIKTMLWTVQDYVERLAEEADRHKSEAEAEKKRYNSEKRIRIDIQEKLQEVTDDLATKEREINRLNNELFTTKETCLSLEDTILTNNEQYQEKMNELLSMSEDRSTYAVTEFKNVVWGSLRIEYIDFMSVIDDEVTVELAENFKVQLINVFNILKERGMVF